jgi:hypothetical protein
MQPLWIYIRVYLKICFKKDLVYDSAILSLWIYAKQISIRQMSAYPCLSYDSSQRLRPGIKLGISEEITG